MATKALSFTLQQNVTALVPPGDARLVDIAISIASDEDFPTEVSKDELAGIAEKYTPIFPSGD